jgi:hypothetical protein
LAGVFLKEDEAYDADNNQYCSQEQFYHGGLFYWELAKILLFLNWFDP